MIKIERLKDTTRNTKEKNDKWSTLCREQTTTCLWNRYARWGKKDTCHPIKMLHVLKENDKFRLAHVGVLGDWMV